MLVPEYSVTMLASCDFLLSVDNRLILKDKITHLPTHGVFLCTTLYSGTLENIEVGVR